MQTRSCEFGRCSRRPTCVTLTLVFALLLTKDAADGKPDVRQSPFSLELQPPFVEAVEEDAFKADVGRRTIDSYGNLIDALRPIDTPDGRKVVSAQGLQFEIPNYASGITDIRKPADNLLPPHIGELTSTSAATQTPDADGSASGAIATTTKSVASTTAIATAATLRKSINQKRNAHATEENVLGAPPTTSIACTNSLSLSVTPSPTPTPTATLMFTHIRPQIEALTKSQREITGQQIVIAPASPKQAPPSFTLLTLNPHLTCQRAKYVRSQPSPEQQTTNYKSIDSLATTYSTRTPSQLDAISVAQTTSDTDSTSFAPALAPKPATSLTPPKHDSSTFPADVSVEVEHAQLVPVNQQQQESFHTPQHTEGTLPDYLTELQLKDNNIAGPVPWSPASNEAPLSVIAWDLLPPLESAPVAQAEPKIITEQQPTKHVNGIEQPGNRNIRVSLGSGQGLAPVAPAPLTSGHVSVVAVSHDGPDAHGTSAHVGTTTPRSPGSRFPSRHRGAVHYSTTSTTRPGSTSPTTTTATPLTARKFLTTTTTTKITTLTTKTPTSTTQRTTTSNPSTTPLDPSTFYKLDNEEAYAYTLPPWLQEVTDPDLDVAVTFEVPTDNDKYNHTVADDLEPPFEPFVDLSSIHLTPPPISTTTTTQAPAKARIATSTTSTTTTTTTMKSPSAIAQPAPTVHTTLAPILKAQLAQRLQVKMISTPNPTAPLKTTEVASTTQAAQVIDQNPFDSATLPSWLQDFDYPDVGPGVPYNPENFNDAQVASGNNTGGTKSNDFKPHDIRSHTIERTTTSTTTASLSSAFPSKVTLTLPVSSSTTNSQSHSHSSSVGQEPKNVEPPLVLIPPIVSSDDPPVSSLHPTTNSITHFPARFDTPVVGGQDSQPTSNAVATAVEQFPPLIANPADSPKVEYTKSDEGKVIITPTTSQRQDGQDNKIAQPQPASNSGKYTGGFGAPAGLLRPHTEAKPDIYVAGNQHEYSSNVKANRGRPNTLAAAGNASAGRYTGGFGAPSGVLSPQNAPRPFQHTQSPSLSQSESHPQLASVASSPHQSRFGGPPGILVPFDNVQRSGAK